VKLKIFHLPHQDANAAMVTAQLLLGGPQGAGAGSKGWLGMLGGLGQGMPAQGPGLQLGGLGGNLGALGGNLGALGGNLGALGGNLGALGGAFGMAGIGGAGIGGFAGGPMPGQLGGGFGALGFGGGGAMLGSGFAGGMAREAVTSLTSGQTRLVADLRAHKLLARGPERDLEIIADLVTVLNASPKKPLPKLKNLHVFPLKYADPHRVAAAVTLLGIGARITPLAFDPAGGPAPDSEEGAAPRLLFVRGTEEQLREIRQVIEAMDVRVPEEDAGP
jgi:hypothetical protein